MNQEKENIIRANLINEFKSQKIILETLFGKEWFINGIDINHPVYKRWSLSSKIIKQNGVFKFPEDKILDIISIILDNYKIVECSRGDIDKFILGTFPNWDEKCKNRMRSEMTSRGKQGHRKFLDKMLELSYEAWHLSKGNNAIHYEKDCYPDFEIHIKDLDFPIVGDCKRIGTETGDKIFGKDIYKANKQIKCLGKECYGIVLVDITDKIRSYIGIYSADEVKNIDTNKIPEEVNRIRKIVQNAVIKDNSSVSGVLLIWNDDIIVGKIPGILSLFHFTKSILVKHLNPIKKITEELDLGKINFGSTFFLEFGLYYLINKLDKQYDF